MVAVLARYLNRDDFVAVVSQFFSGDRTFLDPFRIRDEAAGQVVYG